MNKVVIDAVARRYATRGLCQCPRLLPLCLWTRLLVEVTRLGIPPRASQPHSGVPMCHRLAQTRGARSRRTRPLCGVRNTIRWTHKRWNHSPPGTPPQITPFCAIDASKSSVCASGSICTSSPAAWPICRMNARVFCTGDERETQIAIRALTSLVFRRSKNAWMTDRSDAAPPSH